MGSGRGVPHLSREVDDSEDDRPEEVSLEAAKTDVHKRQSEEQAAKRRLAAEAKAARRRQSQKKEGETRPQETEGSGAQQSRKERSRKRKVEGERAHRQPEGAEQGAAEAEGDADELLPAAVLAELAEKERLENVKRVAARQPSEPRAKTRRKEPTKPLDLRSRSDNVQVVVLASKKTVAEPSSTDAAAFQRERMFGSNRRRSHSMLASPHQLVHSFI
ncbi:hypothetical protein KFL_008770040 [Klebsormidium nitens]|uniref:Uncharacterized protein n=1 Tax=Klebsormidium nitens TaxID=105231 RepID=A0A1Y1IML7_KLENI|nr:hypothetical protein KFL_008770040 [Klebsormidium nitens]|eukprot:GAQ91893.1 hypothetical protein KFL_008770040 [Klebsormidium nitens]